eukprot:CAMPEP_0180460740 /NCGR_PEP_ID=MMETSP1036_2-20121128/23521_1 /TAXON_ID=632150 /ORGANISM="Azadinium spinosum, Strain 3D9" /LENGTH=844 /DNA_ID=CAMNT_0022467443 /DNA_START=64 /DNA_END=2595 /DNA_ORIENTATION=-
MQNCTAVDEALCKKADLETPCFVLRLLPQLMELVRSSRRLPVGEEHAIRRGSREFLLASRELEQRSASVAHQALRFLDPTAHQESKPEDIANFNLVIDSIDSVLEGVDACLRDALEPPGVTAAGDNNGGVAATASEPGTALNSDSGNGGSQNNLGKSSMPKPQVRWRQLIDNDRTMFVPRILVKHNQRVPLPPRLVEAQCQAGLRTGGGGAMASAGVSQGREETSSALEAHLGALGVVRNGMSAELPHPYEEELNALSWADEFFQTRKAEHYGRMEDTPLVLVRTEQELRSMIQEIQATCVGKELAVDVEHHDFRSYRGFVCLVQLSTRQKDFIVDPFDIFPQMHLLNEVFTDPRIVKVLHGADRDVLWLQRDFSVYIVNMFDTGLATRTLRLQGGFSLANLVSHFCGVKLDKKYQTADWRERPLSREMLHYARCDTHYLLYCYDCLKNALLAPGASVAPASAEAGELHATDEGLQALNVTLERSTSLCRLQHLESPFDASNQAMRICERFSSKQRPPEPRQFAALRNLLSWRDRLARSLDESWNFISPDACLWRIALALPATASRLRSTCNPLPGALQHRAQEVVDLVNSGDAAAATTAAPRRAEARTTSAPQWEGHPAWPVRSSGAPLPVVHITAVDTAVVAAAGGGPASAVICAAVESEGSAEEGLDASRPVAVPRRKAERISGAMRFAATAPVRENSFLAVAEVAASEAIADLAMGTATAAPAEGNFPEAYVMPTRVGGVAPVGAVGRPAADAEVSADAPVLRPKKKRRRHEGSGGGECLENVVKKAAVTDPYASADGARGACGAPFTAACSDGSLRSAGVEQGRRCAFDEEAEEGEACR